MERTDIYLEIVMANPLLLAPIVGFVVAFFLVPPEKRLFLSLLLIVPWLTVARSPGLGTIAAAAKLSSGGAFLLVAYAAAVHPAPKRHIPGILWVYPVMAFCWIFLIAGVEERMVALVLRMQWLLVTVAALSLLRTINTFEDFMRIINALTVGCMIALLLPISALVLNPAESFLRGIGRFQPYGANSNQIGMLFALSAPLIGYAMMSWKRISLRPLLVFLIALIIGMVLLTGSRMTALAIAMTLMPIVFVLTKRPVISLLGLAIAAGGIALIMSMAEDTAIDRFGSLESQRTELWGLYITNVFPNRPLFGLLGTGGESIFRAKEVMQHPHSAWFNLMYHGGLFLLIPMMTMVIYSAYSAYQVWKARIQLGGNTLLYSIMCMLLFAMYVQGCFNQVVFWPTYTWSFLHVVLAGWFIMMWQDVKDGFAHETMPSIYDDDEDEFEEESQEEFYDYAQDGESAA